jgi:cytidine deaminase
MENLIQEAKNIIDKRYDEKKFVVGSALRTKSGKIYTGISINVQKLNICCEWIAIGKAFGEGEQDIDMIVAVRRHESGRHEIYPPCGLCRELFITYCPEAEVIIGENEKVRAGDLLPHPWQKKKK